ncbi:dCMP deaminase [Kribbella sp. NBC_01505]|uniref:dCMP deaminase n=1 Tax=Kribbella sp. NBC_01505 TaxID=2903580 RepID=UPI0038702F8C
MADLDDRYWLGQAIDLSRSSPPSTTAFSVGAIIVSPTGDVISSGYSRETDHHDHAEEIALAKLDPHDPRLTTATIYTSLEPCSKRASRPRTCTELILATTIPRVVLAWREPLLFVDCEGAELLTAAGVEVLELQDLANAARQINAHLLR